MRLDRDALLMGLLAFSMAGPALAGERFKASPAVYFTCKNFALDHTEHEADEVGNKLSFSIWITGICAPVEEHTLPSGGWKHVTAKGTYDYTTKKATEDVVLTADSWTAVQLRTTCDSNPWAHTPSCSPPSQLANNTGMDLKGPYPISANLLPSHLRKSIADWEGSKTSSQMLTDWNPLGPAKEEVLVIQKPGYSVPEGASFDVALNALHPQSGWNIELEWARIDPPKDPSIEIAGRWVYDVPTNAPTVVPWGQFPKSVPIPGSFTAGEWALRAKVQGMAENTWTDWKRFWVGKAPTVNLVPKAAIPLGGGKTQQYSMDQPGQVAVFGRGKMRQGNFAKPMAPMKTLQGQLPPGAGPSTGAKVERAAAGKALVKRAAKLSIGTIAVAPVGADGYIQKGAMVKLSVEVKNAGPGEAAATETVKLECKIQSGGPCPLANSTQAIGHAIPAGQSRSITVIGATPSQPGTYEVSAVPVAGAHGSGGEVQLKVKGSMISPAAAKKVTPGVGVQQPKPSSEMKRVPAGRVPLQRSE